MQGYRIDLNNGSIGKYSWDEKHPNYFKKSIQYFQMLTRIFKRFLPDIAKNQELELDKNKVPRFEKSIYSNAAISKNYYSRIHLDFQEFMWPI